MNVNLMTLRELRKVPMRENWSENVTCKSIIILPGRANRLHDSGYRVMDFVAVNENGEAICRLSGCSDVLHIDGIGGFGFNWTQRGEGVPTGVKPRGWSVDCLPKSGCLRLFASNTDIIAEAALSSFEIFAKDK